MNLFEDLDETQGNSKKTSHLEKRKLICTPYDGSYGIAGWVICVEGSPPKGTLVLTERAGKDGPFFYIRFGKSKRIKAAKQLATIAEFYKEHLSKSETPLVVDGPSSNR